jgi:TolB protein
VITKCQVLPRAAHPVGLLLVLLGVGCADRGSTTPTEPGETRSVASVTVTGPAGPLMVGQSAQLEATARDQHGEAMSGVAVEWTSSDEALATVSGTGKVTALAAGAVTITASASGHAGSLPLEVHAAPVTAVLSGIAYVRGERELRVVEPDGSGDRLVWAEPAVDPARPDLQYHLHAPAWRPDGTEIAFSSDHEMAVSLFQQDAYAVRPDGSGLRKLTNGPTHEELAAHPKGTVTVHVSNISFNGGPFFVHVLGASEPQEITLGVGSSATLTFTDVADLGPGVEQPVVVVDGIQRWWDAAVAADVQPGASVDAGQMNLGANPVERFGAEAPAWRSDGSRLAFIVTAFTLGNAACLLNEVPAAPPPGASFEALLDPSAYGPVCAYDRGPTPALADQILVVDNTSDYTETGETHVYRVAEHSPSPGTPVATFDRYVRVVDIRWLPDGSGFVVARQDDLVDEDVNLYEFDFATKSLRKLTDFTGEFVRSLSISPDGQSIAFERVTGGSIHDLATLPSDVWVMQRDGSGLRRLVADARYPAWNPGTR